MLLTYKILLIYFHQAFAKHAMYINIVDKKNYEKNMNKTNYSYNLQTLKYPDYFPQSQGRVIIISSSHTFTYPDFLPHPQSWRRVTFGWSWPSWTPLVLETRSTRRTGNEINTLSGYPLHRENRENGGGGDSLSGKTQGIWKCCQNTGNLVCSSCELPDFTDTGYWGICRKIFEFV